MYERLQQYGYHTMFSSRKTPAEAQEYLETIAQGTESPAHVITGAMVYANTLIKMIDKHYHLTPKDDRDGSDTN